MECNTRYDRSEMIRELTNELCSSSSSSCDDPNNNNGLRFFKRESKQSDSLIELDYTKSREKIAHALRDAACNRQQQKQNTTNGKSMSKSKRAIKEHRQAKKATATTTTKASMKHPFVDEEFNNFL